MCTIRKQWQSMPLYVSKEAGILISLENITKTYRVAKREPGILAAVKSIAHRKYTEIDALNHVSFTINSGEIIGYIGPNGAYI